MKGVILAGGSGSRLAPLTRITNKHLLPLYDRPMVTYAVEALVQAGLEELMLVTGGTHAGEFFRLLGNGHEYGIERLLYAYQDKPGGIRSTRLSALLYPPHSSAVARFRSRATKPSSSSPTRRSICSTRWMTLSAKWRP